LLLDCYLDDVKPLIQLLRAVSFVDEATIVLSDKGIKIVVDEARSLQVRCGRHMRPSRLMLFLVDMVVF
jgi:hypothetical protein